MSHAIDKKRYFLGRQPILDTNQVIVGYELLFRATECNFADIVDHSLASASVISSLLSGFGFRNILGDKLGFINVDRTIFFSELLEVLPPDQTVLELLEIINLDGDVYNRCLELKEKGFKLALDDHLYEPAHAGIYQAVDIVKLDILETRPEALMPVVAELRHSSVRLLAEKVETSGQFNDCMNMGFDLFQGYFFERPEVLKRESLELSQIEMLQLLKKLLDDVDIDEIEEVFRHSPALSYQLLMLVNSVSLALREKIGSLRHAITILGIEKLRRWVQLTLFAVADSRGINNPLLEMAAVRGRLMEHLVMQRYGFSRGHKTVEAAFMTGIFSLLDILFETSMELIVNSLSLTEEISEALLKRQGEFGVLLSLAETLEMANFGEVESLLSESGIPIEQLLEAQLDAFNWRASVN